MDAYIECFRQLVVEEVSSRVTAESQAGYPLGLTDRSFTAITGDLIMSRWERLAKDPGTVDQLVARICGTEKRKGK